MSLKYEPVSVEVESCTDLAQLSVGVGRWWSASSVGECSEAGGVRRVRQADERRLHHGRELWILPN